MPNSDQWGGQQAAPQYGNQPAPAAQQWGGQPQPGGQVPGQGSPPLSPDGRFWWNGYQWVPTGAGGGGGGALKWVAIGCGVLLLLFILLIIIGTVVGRQTVNVFSNINDGLNNIDFSNIYNGINTTP